MSVAVCVCNVCVGMCVCEAVSIVGTCLVLSVYRTLPSATGMCGVRVWSVCVSGDRYWLCNGTCDEYVRHCRHVWSYAATSWGSQGKTAPDLREFLRSECCPRFVSKTCEPNLFVVTLSLPWKGTLCFHNLVACFVYLYSSLTTLGSEERCVCMQNPNRESERQWVEISIGVIPI